MSDERATAAASPTVLPVVPEPILTPEERAALSEVLRDPEFWTWFEQQPEPPDDDRRP